MAEILHNTGDSKRNIRSSKRCMMDKYVEKEERIREGRREMWPLDVDSEVSVEAAIHLPACLGEGTMKDRGALKGISRAWVLGAML